MVRLTNYSLITALSIATSTDPHIHNLIARSHTGCCFVIVTVELTVHSLLLVIQLQGCSLHNWLVMFVLFAVHFLRVNLMSYL